MQTDPFTPVADLRNLGVATAERLEDIGLETLGDIEALGAVETYARLRLRFGNAVSLSALHVLEATLRDVDWRDLPAEVKAGLDAAAAAADTVRPGRAAV